VPGDDLVVDGIRVVNGVQDGLVKRIILFADQKDFSKRFLDHVLMIQAENVFRCGVKGQDLAVQADGHDTVAHAFEDIAEDNISCHCLCSRF